MRTCLWFWIVTSFYRCSCGFGSHGAKEDQRANVFQMPRLTTSLLGQPQRFGGKEMRPYLCHSGFLKPFLTVLLVYQRGCGEGCSYTAALTCFIHSRSLAKAGILRHGFHAVELHYPVCTSSSAQAQMGLFGTNSYPEAPLWNPTNGIGLGKVLCLLPFSHATT